MKKHLSIHNLLATLLTLAALAFGLTAKATGTQSIVFKGKVENGSYSFIIGEPTPLYSGSYQGTSVTFNNQEVVTQTALHLSINGTMSFTEATDYTNVTTSGSVTLTFESPTNNSNPYPAWYYGATVKNKDNIVQASSYSISNNNRTITVTIPSNTSFYYVELEQVTNPPMTNNNTTVTVPVGDYWVSDANHKPTPAPTVVYNNTTTLVKDTDYTLTWSNNSSAGTGNVTATGMGNYAGSATGTFPIRWATYTVHFDKNHNNATGTMANQAFTYATSQHLTANAFSRTYYTFAGWSTTPNGAVTYTDGQSVNNLTAVDDQIVTLYANWTPITYNITYDLDGGSVAIANPTSYTIETPTFTLNNPTKDGYTFAGWTGSNGNTPQTTVTITQGTTGNLNYTAHWTPITYNITYDLDGGSVATANPTTYNIETPTFTLNNPTKLACNFDGWTGSNGDTPETTVTIAQGSYGDRNYTANWTQYAFTLTLGTDITASGTVVFTLDGTDYYTPGTPITLGFSGTIPEGGSVTYSVNGTPIEGNSFVMPAQDTEVTAIIRGPRYTFDSSTGALTLNWGEFNKNNKWGSEVDPSKVRSVTATDEVSFTGDCFNLFYNFTNCTSMDLSNVNTDALTSMYCMFWGCSSLQSLDLSSWNTAAVTAMTLAFYGCEGLTSLNLKGWNTASVTTMEKMFYECHNLTTIEGISEWVTASVTSMEEMFSVCCDLQSLNLSGWNTANVTKMLVMFNGCSSLQSLDLSGWNTSIVWDMSAMFFGCSSLTTIYVGEGWNTESVTSSNYMFTDCTNLVGGMGTGYDANHTNKEYARIDKGPSSDQPGYFTGVAPSYTFDSTTGVLTLLSGRFNKDNKWGSEVTPSAVTSVTATNQVSFTGDCSMMFANFKNCKSMDLNSVNTSGMTDANNMFNYCKDLDTLDLSGWNTANVTDMSHMFNECHGLTTLNLSDWNTANVTEMAHMFGGCSSLQSLDLSGWNTANVTSMISMFRGCTNLVTIYVGEGWNTEFVTSSNYMFTDCTNLVGGMGTTYDENHINKEYARIDRGPNSDHPGYFTGRFNKAIAGYQDNESGWYLIASPLAANVAPADVTNMTNATFDLYYFDQSGGDNGKEWKNYKAHPEFTSLVNGQGYLYANSGNVTLSFTGTPIGGTTNVVTLTKTTGVALEGWNLVGNPFADTAYIIDGRSFYIMNDQGSEIIAVSEMNRNYIKPMEGIFVEAGQDGETMTFTTEEPDGSPSPSVVININQMVTNRGGSTTAVIDRAIVRFDSESTLPKLQIFEDSPKLYIPQAGEEYAIVSAGNMGEIPVNFKATKNGEYTISVNPENVEMGYLHLIDNMTGADVDLLASPEYTFNAKMTDYESRFRLVYSVCGDANGDDEAFAFINNGNIIVNGEGTLQVVDVMGRIVLSGDAINRVSTGGMAPGVYVLRLINGEDVRTQRIVVK